HYREAESVVEEYNLLAEKAARIAESLPAEYHDAYYQLVLHPTKACAILNELYLTVAQNRLYTQQGRALTNELTMKAKELFAADSAMSFHYNKILSGGKWNHMMDQTHISYTYWQQPDKDVLPRVETIHLPQAADMGIAIQGSESWWPLEKSEAVLPSFDPLNRQAFYIDIFNRGSGPLDYSVKTARPWIILSSVKGALDQQQRLWVSVDWAKVPVGDHDVPITIAGAKKKIVVHAVVKNGEMWQKAHGFVESNGSIAIDAAHYSRKVDVAPVRWQIIPNLGRTGSAMMPEPVTAVSQTPGERCPRLEYDVTFAKGGAVSVHVQVSPTLNFHNNQGLRYALSLDDAPPRIVNIHENFSFQDWEEAVRRNIIESASEHVAAAGQHVLKFWMIDPGVVLQKLIIDTGGLQPSYMGPPESAFLP
ncbi:glycosyl hydrolase, partial [candidate division KSB1 bacterium]|nr:glycosyl hydrolase [candidate division KSB1 bacterium]